MMVLLFSCMLLATPMASNTPIVNDLELDYRDVYETSNSSLTEQEIDTLLSGLNTSSIPEIVGIVDSNSNYQIIWYDSNINQIVFSMFDNNGLGIIAPTNLPTGSSGTPSDLVVDIDSDGWLYLFWSDLDEIYALAINSSEDDQDGDQALVNDIIVIPPTSLVDNSNGGIRYDPDVVIDRFDAIHMVWVDTEDPLGILYGIPQVKYLMTAHDGNGGFQTVIGSTMITATLSTPGNPAISMGDNDTVVLVWQDTSHSVVEYVGILDTSGSMTEEWVDMCTVFYGGSFSFGGQFDGIKPLMEQSNVTVLETLYALAATTGLPTSTTGAACTNAVLTGGNGNQGPRATHLGQTASDNSGGIRYLADAIFNNQSIALPPGNGGIDDGSEDWGPGTTWACQSWRDAVGRLGSAANPPTPADHRWNPNATKFVLPVSDEGPKSGEPSGEAQDYDTINEAHDACVLAGITPIPMIGENSQLTLVGSHMMDLAQCPNAQGQNMLVQRTCLGTTVRNTDAGGNVYQFPTSGSGSAQAELLVQSIINLASNGTTEILMSVLAPYTFVSNARSSWSPGDSGSFFENGEYQEYVGPSLDTSGYGNLVIVDDTRITETAGYSKDPDVVVDEYGDIHVTWSDHRAGISTDVYADSQLNYARIDPDRMGENDGSPLLMSESAIVSPSRLIHSDLNWASKPVIDLDSRGVNIAWFESSESLTSLRWLSLSEEFHDYRQNVSQSVYDVYEEVLLTEVATTSNSMMGISGSDINGTHPIVSFDYPRTTFFWTNQDCMNEDTSESTTDLCASEIIDYSLEIERLGNDNVIQINPDEYTKIFFELDAIFVPGTSDIISITTNPTPQHWYIEAGFTTNKLEQVSVSTGSEYLIQLDIRSPILRLVDENLTFNLDIIIQSIAFDKVDLISSVTINFFNPNGFADDDNDGILDAHDTCPWGDDNWYSDEFSDHDSDGCRDSTEDTDDDNDWIHDDNDNCPQGLIGSNRTDLDGDGCDDNVEDIDLDQDGIINLEDDCPQGQMYWDPSTDDYDGDGCADSTEDLNDDNDPFLDVNDDCPKGELNWQDVSSNDYDSDGCHDIFEDIDDDDDGIIDSADNCPRGHNSWFSNLGSDYDQDGCLDTMEDSDTDNDGIENSEDSCPMSIKPLLQSTVFTDWDRDGCMDEFEDIDDDNDGFSDDVDYCIRSDFSSSIDLDNDGCMDLTEDDDLDNDGVLTFNDRCEENRLLGIKSNLLTDFDGDGCIDDLEDEDDDGDGIADIEDECAKSPVLVTTMDTDSDGCLDDLEDNDNDNDGVSNSEDNCPSGVTGWISEKANDIDLDGCLDSVEDKNIEYSLTDRLNQYKLQVGIVLLLSLLLSIGRYSQKINSHKPENTPESEELVDFAPEFQKEDA